MRLIFLDDNKHMLDGAHTGLEWELRQRRGSRPTKVGITRTDSTRLFAAAALPMLQVVLTV